MSRAMENRHAGLVEDLRSRIAKIGKTGVCRAGASIVPFGVAAIDAALPEHGLACGALHEMAGAGPDTEHGCAAALLAAGILGRRRGTVLWIVDRPDLFAPALSQVGLHPDRVIFAQASRANGVLLAMEEGLRHRGLGGVVGELDGRLALTHSRRLQLAAEASGVMAVVLRRSRRHDDLALSQPTAAATRWRVAMLPSPPVLPHAPDTPGLAPARWRLELTRCRGGQPSSWIVEASDAKGRLRLVAELAPELAPGSAARDVAA